MPGPIYFAYVDQGTAFDAAVHNVEDEEIYSFETDHSEGDFCAVELTLKNPRVGLLHESRKQWAHLSIDINWPNLPATIKHLFYGRLVAVPDDIQEEVINLSFLAKPIDVVAQKAAVAATYRAQGAPYWSATWFDPDKRDEPDNVLESRCELWDFNRTTHEVTTTNIANGEDGTITFTADEVYYDGMQTSYGETPLKTVNMKATVTWDQVGSGIFEIGPHFNFGAGGGMPGGNGGGPGVVLTYTGKGLADHWPKSGANLGNGWSIYFGQAIRVDGQGQNVYYTNVGDASDTVDNPFSYRQPFSTGPLIAKPHVYEHAVKLFVPSWLRKWRAFGQQEITRILAVMRWRMAVWMNVRYEASRRYTETINMSLSADCQDIFTDTGGEDILNLVMSSSNIATPIDPDGALPIGDVRNSAYFTGDRGEQDIQYLICIMRSRLIMRARTVDIVFDVNPFVAILADISCKKNAAFPDPRLPGTNVAGKIKNYKIGLDGDTGKFYCTITMGCMIGKGGTVTAVAGDPTYVQEGYVQPGWQRYDNKYVMPISGEVLYKSINGLPPNDDGFNLIGLDNKNCVKSVVKENGWQVQEAALLAGQTDQPVSETGPYPPPEAMNPESPSDVLKRLEPFPTRFSLVMEPRLKGGPFATERTVELSDLKLSKTIDLEAGSIP